MSEHRTPENPVFTESGEPYKECFIVCVPMPTPTGEWYVDSVEIRWPNGTGGLDAELFRDPMKAESYPTKEEAHRAGVQHGREVIDSR